MSKAVSPVDEEAPNNSSELQLFTIDDAFTKSIGQFGRGQQWLWMIASMSWIPGAIQTLVMVFLVQNPIEQGDWKCLVQVNSTTCQDLYDNVNGYTIEQITEVLCDPNRGFEWEWTDPRNSIISTFNTHCDSWMGQFSNSGFFLGFGVGAGVWGWFTNRFGRRTGIFVVVLLSCVFGCLNSTAWNYWSYTVIRTLVGFASSGVGLIGFILSTEPLGLEWRGWAGVMNQCFFPIGEMIIALVAIFVANWRLLNFISALTQGLYLLLIPLMLESARWQLVEGQKDKALKGLQQIAKMNKTQVPEGDLVDTTALHSAEKQKVSLGDVFQHKTLRIRMLILVYGWCISCMVYYGVQLNLGAVGGSLAVNIFLMGFVEFLSYLVGAVIVEQAGRGFVATWGVFLSGISSFVIGSVSSHTLRITFSLIGKFCASLAFGTIFAYTVELFPTVVRSTCLGSCSLSARVGGLLAPLVVIVGTYCGMFAVYSIFGTTAVIAGVFLAFLPETRGYPFMETLEDVDKGPNQLNKYTWFGLYSPKKSSALGIESNVQDVTEPLIG